ncbi:MAG: hypothetical protein J6T64_05135 [Bacteroidaceae bacterium]|nr:hypothetical protein [Bacteroidaceae bacterium]
MKHVIYYLTLLVGLTAPTNFILAQNNLDSALVVNTIEGEDEDTASTGTWTFNQNGPTMSVNDSITVEYDNMEEFLDDVFGGHPKGLSKLFNGFAKWGWVYALIPILLLFVFPLLVLFLIFFFVYKGQKAKYRSYEKMAASGRPISQEMLNHITEDEYKMRNEGIRDICVGIGLAIFLGIIIHELGIGIGALVVFIGLGKLMAWYANNKDKRKAKSEGNYDKDMAKSEGSYDKNVVKSEGNYDKDIKQ